MASGILGTPTELTVTTYTTVYTVPSETFAVASVSIVNKNSIPVSVRLAVSDNDIPSNAEFLEYDTTVAAKSMLERTGIVLQAGKKIVAYSNLNNCNIIAFGIETVV